jgi:hypothetical protein
MESRNLSTLRVVLAPFIADILAESGLTRMGISVSRDQRPTSWWSREVLEYGGSTTSGTNLRETIRRETGCSAVPFATGSIG